MIVREPCSVCEAPGYCRGLCAKHYYRMKRAGQMAPMGHRTRPNVKVDCQHPIAKHKHGTVVAYTHDGCGCDECVEAKMASQRKRRKELAYGRHKSALVPSIGTQRRLQALQWLGYSQNELARRLKTNPDRVNRLARRPMGIQREFAKAIADLFEQLCMAPLPAPSPSVNRARSMARSQGWVPPMAWDDIDDPDEQPKGLDKAGRMTKDEYVEEALMLRSFGVRSDQIAKRLGISESYLRGLAPVGTPVGYRAS
jgi:ribosome-binding protein aMBF1 (putative translation factor)